MITKYRLAIDCAKYSLAGELSLISVIFQYGKEAAFTMITWKSIGGILKLTGVEWVQGASFYVATIEAMCWKIT